MEVPDHVVHNIYHFLRKSGHIQHNPETGLPMFGWAGNAQGLTPQQLMAQQTASTPTPAISPAAPPPLTLGGVTLPNVPQANITAQPSQTGGAGQTATTPGQAGPPPPSPGVPYQAISQPGAAAGRFGNLNAFLQAMSNRAPTVAPSGFFGNAQTGYFPGQPPAQQQVAPPPGLPPRQVVNPTTPATNGTGTPTNGGAGTTPMPTGNGGVPTGATGVPTQTAAPVPPPAPVPVGVGGSTGPTPPQTGQGGPPREIPVVGGNLQYGDFTYSDQQGPPSNPGYDLT